MSTEYKLTVINNSTSFRDFCVYQKPVDLGVPDAMPLAWLTAPAWPDTSVEFGWSIDYNFVWSQVGTLKPGVTFRAQQTLPADPESLAANQTLFDYRNGAFKFVPGTAHGDARIGSLYIRQLDAVPAREASVGIGMSGSGVFAVESQPNMNVVFTPHPSYWVTAGDFEHQEVIDIEEITNEAEIGFRGTTEMVAELTPRNTWNVRTKTGSRP